MTMNVIVQINKRTWR